MYKLGAANAGGSSRILDVICEGRTFGMLARVECFVSSYGTSNIYALILWYAYNVLFGESVTDVIVIFLCHLLISLVVIWEKIVISLKGNHQEN